MSSTAPGLAALHQELAGILLAGRELDAVLTDVVTTARRALPGAEAVSITLLRGDKAFTAAHDGKMALDADEMQYARGYGPCLDAGRAGQVFVVEEMATEERWPDYCRHAAAAGVGSSVSLPLPVQGRTLGALNCYSSRPRSFGEDDVALGQEVAAFVAIAVANADSHARSAEDAENMRRAMASRAVIEQAKGVLVERHKVTPEQAFTLLTHASQRTNVKLNRVAEELVTTGVLPGAVG
ncbi:GAF and ANTAR domain-containing protein [Paenibacillus sp. TRM 82003]|uniref:GAF and ANTAR domain-containing protein n=1 Tax=Kineococcus sp. TRM81007 TaxID=2925831 RepID=UPI001F57FC43|nr:GAF and ANTAR domain-containing protein [Kineococcus sp. TRM81007]MCI2237877.1 GAF and ANTAR domain-containing protein [Kineococcus sp. TRM81007]MCI3924608.1 GAF and ANTAR domain-containing protein [Paenibacillus sp. TRM 82003]